MIVINSLSKSKINQNQNQVKLALKDALEKQLPRKTYRWLRACYWQAAKPTNPHKVGKNTVKKHFILLLLSILKQGFLGLKVIFFSIECSY